MALTWQGKDLLILAWDIDEVTAMTVQRDLALYNANIITMNSARPRARSLVCRQGRIAQVSDRLPSNPQDTATTTFLDCQEKTVVPGFIDAHTHFLAYASSLRSVDCGPRAVKSIDELGALLALQAREMPRGRWIKARGYDEYYLTEKRHPTRWDLDPTTPQTPVKLVHRSGHAVVLNSYAMRLAGISGDTPEPEGGVVDRDVATGEPTGLFFELEEWLDQRLGLTTPGEEMDLAIREASKKYITLGITSFHDASPSNSVDRWRYFEGLKEEGALLPRVTVMPGCEHLREMIDTGLGYKGGADGLRVGHGKIMLNQTSGVLHPSRRELKEMVKTASGLGFPVAIHAVEEEEVKAAIDALELVQEDSRARGLRHRIEHCSLCPPALHNRLAKLNVTIVTQPAFLHHSGDRYLQQVPKDKLPWLYPLGSWLKKGIRVAGSSDGPVAPSNPLLALQSAVTRRAASGERLGPEEAISTLDSLAMYTLNGAWASGQEGRLGKIAPGMVADMVILTDDPTNVRPEAISKIRVWGTVLGGELMRIDS